MFSAVFNRSLPRGGRGYLPVDNRSPRDTDCNIPRLVRHGVPTFLSVGLAALAGTLLGFSLLSFISRPDYGHYQPSQALPDDIASLPNTSPYIQPPLRPSDLEHLSVEALEDIVAQTKGYWVRDWSLHLGWNNVRIPGPNLASLTHAQFHRCGISSKLLCSTGRCSTALS